MGIGKEEEAGDSAAHEGEQRIQGDSDFVLGVLTESGEKFEQRYEMKRLGYDLDKIEERVCELFTIEKGTVFSRSRVKVKADARADFAFGRSENRDTD